MNWEQRNHLLRLQKDWDSYGGKPITRAAMESTERLVAMLRSEYPQIVPKSDGGLQIEWHSQGMDCELEIAPDGTVEPIE